VRVTGCKPDRDTTAASPATTIGGGTALKTVGALTPMVVVVALTHCTVGPHYLRPATEVVATRGCGAQTAVHVDEPIDLRWWEAFGDPQLARLVTQPNRSEMAVSAALIARYKALGGGWEPIES